MNAGTNTSDDWIPQTAREWYEWLVQEEKKTSDMYHIKPNALIAEYRRERDIARDYEGREILELLQNANDQAAEQGQRGRVLIELSPIGLIVANTGLAFSVGGVVSLQTSHLSPKRRKRKQLIGNKGLGFRAVLNWSRSPIILSNALCLAYCTEHAKNKLKALTAGCSELARVVREEQQGGDTVILPLLPFPLYSENGDLSARLADEKTRESFERCEALLVEGYDTVIGMPFDTASGHEVAHAQITEVRPEILLFAQHLGELCFRCGDNPPVIWRREGNDKVAEVVENGKPLGKWQIHRTAGKLPEAVITADQGEATDYEIVVALRTEGSSTPGPLYSHFPTDITLPLPLVCHATLELEQSRMHMQQGRKCNGYVLARLAEWLAEIAEDVAAKVSDDPWAGCALLMPKADCPSELVREGFCNKLIQFAKTHSIVPTLSGKPVTPVSARSVPGADPSWLPAELFPEVVPIRDTADTRFLSTLDVPELGVEEIKNRIVANSNLTTDQRIALIAGLIVQKRLREAYTSALFLDETGHGLGDGMRVFLAPSSGEAPKLPDWADLRFLNEDMRSKLTKQLEVSDVRGLQQKLSEFGLLEYSQANVIRALVAEANRASKVNPENLEMFRADLLRTVFGLYVAEDSGNKRPEYPEQSPLHLPNQSHSVAVATMLYLGSGTNAHGEITQALFEPWAPEKLVDVKRLSGLTADREKLRDFLLWIGVAQWPRSVIKNTPEKEYLQHTLRSITFPAQFGEKVVSSQSEATSSRVSDVQSVDGLDEILSKAAPAAIAAWLASDDRALGWGRRSQSHAKLQAYPDNVRNSRVYQGSLPSYIRWRIESTPWLRSADRKELKPKDCVLGERAIEDLFPRPAMPDQDTLEHYGVQQREVLEGWQRAGVLTSLAYLERDEIYAKLLELPQRSPDGKLARPLYHWLLDANDSALGSDGANQKEFLARGRMWGRHGRDQSYFPIAELHHADSEGLPEVLLQELKIVALRKRAGSDKVERLFGVKPVDRSGIQRRVVNKEVAGGSFQANTDFQAAKPYLHKLRAYQTSQLAQLQVLKDLELSICSKLEAELIFEGVPVKYSVSVYEWLIEDKILYVRSDPAKPMMLLADSLLADAIGQALASVFRIADSGGFAQLLACKEEDRLVLLQRMLGESELGDIEVIKSEYASFKPHVVIEALYPVTEPPKVGSPQTGESILPTPEPAKIENSLESTYEEYSEPLQVIEEEHVPEPVAKPRALQIRTLSPSGGQPWSQHRALNGDFCERKAMEFEEASVPTRWPLPVGQIMGAEGPGCDVLSFATQEEREAFRRGPIRDLNTVIRFIEVKGRGSAAATIELKGNQLSAAGQHGDRYFLYRLFRAEDGTFELTILQNPLKHQEALQPAVYVGMEQAKATQRFSLIGGLKNEAGS